MAKQLIFYLEPTRGLFFGEDLTEVKEMPFPPEVINDLEVIDKEKLEALFVAVLQTYQITPSPLIIILSSAVTFDKDISEIPEEKRVSEVKQFLDIVPFQEYCSKIFSAGKKTTVTVANNTLIDTLSSIFKKQQFMVSAVIPYSIMQELFPSLIENFDPALLIVKADSCRQYSLLNVEEATRLSTQSTKGRKNSNKRLFLLIGVFALLMVILIVVVVINYLPQQSHFPSVTVPKSSSLPNATTMTTTTPSARGDIQAVAGSSTERTGQPKMYYIQVGHE